MIAGAGAAYLNGGLGWWDFAFCALMTFVAYRGFKDYRLIALGWLLHTGWDVLHHLLTANPIVPFVPSFVGPMRRLRCRAGGVVFPLRALRRST